MWGTGSQNTPALNTCCPGPFSTCPVIQSMYRQPSDVPGSTRGLPSKRVVHRHRGPTQRGMLRTACVSALLHDRPVAAYALGGSHTGITRWPATRRICRRRRAQMQPGGRRRLRVRAPQHGLRRRRGRRHWIMTTTTASRSPMRRPSGARNKMQKEAGDSRKMLGGNRHVGACSVPIVAGSEARSS